MSLREYRRKRNFKRTTEPEGTDPARTTGRQFVVQMHAARRLHYDLRLELEGVLKSWAVPRGPSLDPGVKSLAVEVEDHPLTYATFEGVIPKGEYGGGTVMVWDRGEWEPEGNAVAGLKKGRLRFVLRGEKLAGGWLLVRIKARDSGNNRPNWLLIKRDDAFAQSGGGHAVTEAQPTSVVTGRTLQEIAADADRVWSSNGRSQETAGKAHRQQQRSESGTSSNEFSPPDPSGLTGTKKLDLPASFAPQLATPTRRIPEGDDWIHELKFDGYRLLCFVNDRDVRLVTRRGKDWTRRFPSVAKELKVLGPAQSLFDGELVALDSQGASDFQRLQNRMASGREEELVLYVFDVPFFAGYSLQRTPLLERKELLAKHLLAHGSANDGIIRYSDHIRGHGPEVLEHSCRAALEGVVSKRVDSPYESRRSRNWLKSKCQHRQEFVIGGFTRPQGARKQFGALLVGYRRDDRWVYCGRVGTGFTEASLRDLGARLRSLKRSTPPFLNPPRGARARGVTWIEPQLVAEVEFSEWTDDGLLRHPSFQGLREDKAADDVVREDGETEIPHKEKSSRSSTSRGARRQSGGANPAADTVANVVLTHPERVLYPDQGLTKRQLAGYYEAIADWILPHVVDRPLTLVRCPRGRAGKCFYQKHWTDSLPEAVDCVLIRERDAKERYVVIHDLPGLISLVQMNVLEMHPWGARIDRLEQPDRIVFDLDPGPGVAWTTVMQAAADIREILADAGLTSFVRTSGGKGLHVVAPLTRRNDWTAVGDFAEDIAKGLARRSPKLYVANMRKNLRQGRVFIDYLRNRRGATSIASYSTRARARAPVATPLAWDELADVKSADQWTVANVPGRLQSLKSSPWRGFGSLRQSITQAARDVALALSGRSPGSKPGSGSALK